MGEEMHIPDAEKGSEELHEVTNGTSILHENVNESNTQHLKLDKHGLPLIPQPTDFKDDPLNWSPAWKLFVALQVSWLACLGPMSAAVINPVFVTLGKAFKITTVEASYQFTVFILFAGVAPLLLAPLANVYGRRPLYLVGSLLASITNIIAGHCNLWPGILVTRVFNGIGAGICVALGAATICDLYCMHERGLYMGIYAFALTNGPHIAPLIGGYIAQRLGWRWCFSLPGYIQLGTFIVNVFLLPETLYSRGPTAIANHRPKSHLDLLLFRRNVLTDRTLTLHNFLKPFLMLRYISVIIPGLYYMTIQYGTILFAVTGSKLFAEFYHFNTAQTGLILSVPLLIGCLIGEFNAGWLIDWMVHRYAKSHDGKQLPEARLNAIPFVLLIPIGLIIDGICITHHATVPWIGRAMSMGIASLGLQVATTMIYVYTTDCYKPQSAEISSLLNTFKSCFGALMSFYAIRLGDKIEFQYAWLTLAMINVAFLVPLCVLRFKGEGWRALKWQAPPNYHADI